LKYRQHLPALVCVLITIMMLGRVFTSVAGSQKQPALHIALNILFALACALRRRAKSLISEPRVNSGDLDHIFM
jgi:hypothetical protein